MTSRSKAIRSWSVGDLVYHTGRPEWGAGKVIKAEAAVNEGLKCQRLTVRFDRVGVKTVSTAFAELEAASTGSLLPPPPPPSVTFDWMPAPLPAPVAGQHAPRPERETKIDVGPAFSATPLPAASEQPRVPDAKLTELPENITDAFIPVKQRCLNAVALFKFTGQGASLYEWAIIQTGLRDPLAQFNRHELEQLFGRYRFNLEQHLKKLLRELRRQGPEVMQEVFRAAPPVAHQALRRLDSWR